MAESKTESTAEPKRLTVEQAKERARSLTGRSPHLVAGALAGSGKATFTEAEVKKAVNDYVKRPEAGSEEGS